MAFYLGPSPSTFGDFFTAKSIERRTVSMKLIGPSQRYRERDIYHFNGGEP